MDVVDPAECRRRFGSARRALMASTGSDNQPHLVPVTFALLEEDVLVHAVDHKPKRTNALRRLRTIAENPRVAFLVDRYDDDWARLWWVRADAEAVVIRGGDRHSRAVAALAARYQQYTEIEPTGPVVWATVNHWAGWSAGGA